MAKIFIDQLLAKKRNIDFVKLCPFGAIEYEKDLLAISAGCRMCRLCCKKSDGVFTYVEEECDLKKEKLDKTQWQGITVVAELSGGKVHPVTLELIGKARLLAQKSFQNVNVLLMGYQLEKCVEELNSYGVDALYVYDDEALEHFRIEPYCACMEDFIHKNKPSTILVGGTQIGRSLAPRAAARFRTGLTADCTILDMQENTDLDQIRPAYGGNIMAHIRTPGHRPQFATVRYKIFPMPEKTLPHGEIHYEKPEKEKLVSALEFLRMRKKASERGIEDAEVIVVAGRGLKKAEDVEMLKHLASLLGGELGCTRAMVESSWVEAKRQIGLSGRTVKPKLIITCAVSGAVQFAAGMNGSEKIIAINTDKNAPIFNIAHIGIVGDVYKIVPELIKKIEEEKKKRAE